MTVKELIDVLSVLPQDYVVHTDEDDYPSVVGAKSFKDYDGPQEYAPAVNTVLLIIE